MNGKSLQIGCSGWRWVAWWQNYLPGLSAICGIKITTKNGNDQIQVWHLFSHDSWCLDWRHDQDAEEPPTYNSKAKGAVVVNLLCVQIEEWRRVLREGIFPQYSIRALEALRHGLVMNDPDLIQGKICEPDPLYGLVEKTDQACLLCYGPWKSFDVDDSVGAIEGLYVQICFECNRIFRAELAPAFIGWWDDTPREIAIVELLAEVELELANRSGI